MFKWFILQSTYTGIRRWKGVTRQATESGLRTKVSTSVIVPRIGERLVEVRREDRATRVPASIEEITFVAVLEVNFINKLLPCVSEIWTWPW